MKKRISIILVLAVFLISTVGAINTVSAAEVAQNNVQNEVITENTTKNNVVTKSTTTKAEKNVVNNVITNVKTTENKVKENISNSVDQNKVNEVKKEVTETYSNVKKELTPEIIAIRDNAIAKLEEVEKEYNIDLTEYKNRIKAAVNKYQTQEDYTVEDLTAEVQTIYNYMMKNITSDEAKQKIKENIAQTYADIRAYVEKEIAALRNSVSEEMNKVKEKYPELEIIEEDILENIQEYEDNILETIEDFQADPKGTSEELLANVKTKINNLKNTVQKRLAQVRDFVKNGTPIPFDTLDGDGQKFYKDNPEELSFRFKMWYLLFYRYGNVYVDGNLVDKTNYTFKRGSTIVTLKEEYLQTLDNGEHTLKIALGKNKIFGEANATFSVAESSITENEKNNEANATSSISPKTGDGIKYFIALAGVSIISLVSTVIIKKNKED